MDCEHVVFGATGALGSAVVRCLIRQKKTVRAVVRDPEKGRLLFPDATEVFGGDARNTESIRRACLDSKIVYNCINVPFSQWDRLFLSLNGYILQGVRQAKARLVFPGNVYGYGPLQQLFVTEKHPMTARTKKGRLRHFLEANLWKAHHTGEAPLVIVRMPDFYGPNVTNDLYGALFRAALKNKKAAWFGRLDVLHDFVFIEDAAQACVLLADTDSAYGQSWHVSGAGPLTAKEFIEMIFQAAQRKASIKTYGRFEILLGGLFNPALRELYELMYLFQESQVLSSEKFKKAFPDFLFTPHRQAVEETLLWFKENM